MVQSLKENNLLKNLKIQGWKTVDKINDADYFIKGLVAKVADSVSLFVKGVEILPDGSVVRTGTTIAGNSKKPMMPQRRVFRVGFRIWRVVGLRVRVKLLR